MPGTAARISREKSLTAAAGSAVTSGPNGDAVTSEPNGDRVLGDTQRAMPSFGSAMKWSAVMNGGRQAGNLAVSFVLAYLLGPQAFGVIALAMVYVGLIQLVMQQGMGSALVQRRTLTEAQASTGFWMVMTSAAVLTVLALTFSGWWASVNNEPQLDPVIRGLTPLLLIRALIVVPDALLRRRMQFKPLALRMNLSVIGGGLVGVTAAAAGAGVWSLVLQQLVMAVLEAVVVLAAADWRPRLVATREAARELFTFSWKSGVASFGVFASSRIDVMIVGIFLGTTTVGLYRFAVRLVHTVLDSISGSLQAVSLPELARMQHDPARLSGRVLFLYRLTTAVCLVPLCALAAAGPAVIAILGSEWSEASNAVAILCLAGVGSVVGSLVGPVLQAIGQPGRLALLSWAAAALSGAVLVVFARGLTESPVMTQVTALAVIKLGLNGVLFLVVNLVIVGRAVGLPRKALFGALVPGSVAGGAGYLAGWLADQLVVSVGVPPVLRAIAVGGLAFVVASGVISTLDPDLRRSVVAVLRRSPRINVIAGGS